MSPDDDKHFATYCQHCIFQTHPEMLTGYCITEVACDRCGHTADCAMVRIVRDNGCRMTSTIINLSRPVDRERVRGFQPPWYTVWHYRCEQGHTIRVRANSFRGKAPEPSVGAIVCPQCEFAVEVDPVEAIMNRQEQHEA